MSDTYAPSSWDKGGWGVNRREGVRLDQAEETVETNAKRYGKPWAPATLGTVTREVQKF